MVTISAYARPTSVAEACDLLDRSGAIVLGGGTALHALPPEAVVEVVDLQALRLDGIDTALDDSLVIGATSTLQHLVDSEPVPPVVREAARRELPSTLRAQATLGGCIATGDAESELLAALLVHEAVVRIGRRTGTEECPLQAVLADIPLPAGAIVMAVTIRTSGVAAAARTGRTSADRAIVAAYARAVDGRRLTALSGVAATPILVDGADALDPPGDFRGSAGYRRALAPVLLARAVEALA